MTRIVVALLAAALSASPLASAPRPPAISTVKVVTDRGHGTGVHIGGGRILTANHVIEDQLTIEVRDEYGQTRPAKVERQDKQLDVAVLQIAKPRGLHASPVTCRLPVIGEPIVAVGNPVIEDWVHLRGYIASNVRRSDPEWRWVVLADLTIALGMSGGPLFNANKEVLGVVVGGIAEPNTRSSIAVTYAVPSSAFCSFIGQAK